jgi:hypothetical protein
VPRLGRKPSSRVTSTPSTLGGVPTGKIRYDNLKAAVASVIGFSR